MSVQGTYVLLVTATTAEQRAKELLLSEEVLAHYDANKPILLQDDASNYGIGAAHSHIMEDGIERPVGFGSRTLNAAERNYSQLDKEGAALMFAFKNFHNHINGGCFAIMTDHKPLVSLFGALRQVPVTAPPRVQRWAVQDPLPGWQKPWQCGLSQ